MTVYLIDARVAIKWFIPEIHSVAARYISRAQALHHVPELVRLEVGASLGKRVDVKNSRGTKAI